MQSACSQLHCGLCQTANTQLANIQHTRRLWHCQRCDLIFVDPAERLSQEEEKAQYDLHQNSSDDPRYRAFLSQLATPLIQRLQQRTDKPCGLDFGCGPSQDNRPALQQILIEAGYPTAVYDPIYADYPDRLQKCYDFVTATEVIEHLHHPGEVLEQLWSMLKPQGYLAIMTQRWDQQANINQWRYLLDTTHVSFFATATFEWWADQQKAELEIIDRNVCMLRKL